MLSVPAQQLLELEVIHGFIQPNFDDAPTDTVLSILRLSAVSAAHVARLDPDLFIREHEETKHRSIRPISLDNEIQALSLLAKACEDGLQRLALRARRRATMRANANNGKQETLDNVTSVSVQFASHADLLFEGERTALEFFIHFNQTLVLDRLAKHAVSALASENLTLQPMSETETARRAALDAKLKPVDRFSGPYTQMVFVPLVMLSREKMQPGSN